MIDVSTTIAFYYGIPNMRLREGVLTSTWREWVLLASGRRGFSRVLQPFLFLHVPPMFVVLP